ncbi:MAG: hypothetical protein A3K10_16685 [Bacteroidetes bacterium RIFCSPLOWO2_12_FULL_31_6]|nr:MAG: hypothetical protein A3K10_16685 [Bacteroidetes bacterium RIFCSPLOWO2_12_FULL_31_6]
MSYSQDTIHLMSGSSIFAKVAEISSTEVKYKKPDNTDGPSYIELIKDVRSIKYKNGYEDIFQNQAEVAKPKEINSQNSILFYADTKNPDVIILKHGDTIRCSIDKIKNKVIYYHYARRGADGHGEVPFSKVNMVNGETLAQSEVLPILNPQPIKSEKVVVKNVSEEILKENKVLIISETKTEIKPTEIKNIDKPWLMADTKEEERSKETKNVDKPWLIKDSENEDTIKKTKEFQKPWLIPDKKTESKAMENIAPQGLQSTAKADKEIASVESPASYIKTTFVNSTIKSDKAAPIKQIGNFYLHNHSPINEFEMQRVLYAVNDPQITNLLNTANKQKRGQYIGFAAIPCGIAGVACFGLSALGSQESDLVGLGVLLGFATAASISTSITLKCKRVNNNKAALKLYNQNY